MKNPAIQKIVLGTESLISLLAYVGENFEDVEFLLHEHRGRLLEDGVRELQQYVELHEEEKAALDGPLDEPALADTARARVGELVAERRCEDVIDIRLGREELREVVGVLAQNLEVLIIQPASTLRAVSHRAPRGPSLSL